MFLSALPIGFERMAKAHHQELLEGDRDQDVSISLIRLPFRGRAPRRI